MSISDDQAIVYLNQREDEDSFSSDLIHVFEIDNPVQRDGHNVVPTPSSTVPPCVPMDQDVKDQLDAGFAAFAFSVLSLPFELPDDQTANALMMDYQRHEEAFRAFYDAYWRSPEPLPPVVTETSPGARLCRCCDSPLDDRGPRALYCSAACRQLSYRLRQRQGIDDHGHHAAGR